MKKKQPVPRPGRRTTGSKSTPTVSYRVSASQRAELAAEAARLGLASANEAAKRRAFPVVVPGHLT